MIDKIIEELEEFKKENIGEINSGFIETCIEIVKKHENDGWTLCSERLPKECNDYLVTQYNENAIDDSCDGYRIETLFYDATNGWWDDIDFSFGWNIIAWREKPQPYKEKANDN
ncbi:MAG: hypothetical protein PHX08_08125 [Lachnospiraceae bacterium]|nr:hypothetical protein [Lachnospiraceae bacterium]